MAVEQSVLGLGTDYPRDLDLSINLPGGSCRDAASRVAEEPIKCPCHSVSSLRGLYPLFCLRQGFFPEASRRRGAGLLVVVLYPSNRVEKQCLALIF